MLVKHILEIAVCDNQTNTLEETDIKYSQQTL